MQSQLFLVFAFCLFLSPVFGQPVPPANRSALSIEQIMQGEKFTGYSPEDMEWSEDGQSILFSWNPNQDTLRSTYRVDLSGGAPRKLSYAEIRDLMEGWAGTYNGSRSHKVYSRAGDLYLLDLGTMRRIRLTQTADQERNPRFVANDSQILYERDGNLFTWDLRSGAIRQLTNFRRGNEPKTPASPAHRRWLEQQQQELFDVLRNRKRVQSLQEQLKDSTEEKQPREIFYGNKRLFNLQASPNLRFVTATLVTSVEPASTQVPFWVTESGYVEPRSGRSKVGSPQDTYEMGIYDTQRDTFYFLDAKQLPGIYDKPSFLKEYHRDTTPFKERYDKPREVLWSGPLFSADGKAVVIARALNGKDRWIMSLDLVSGKLGLLDRQHDDAWIAGPGIGGFNAGTAGWLPDQQHFFFQSEESGYSHLYLIHVPTGKKTALTSGSWEVRSVDLSRDSTFFYLTAGKDSPHERHLYRLPVKGGNLEKITTKPGFYEVSFSPDERNIALRYSYSNQPWELYLMENKPGAEMRRLTESTTPAFKAYTWRDPEIIYFPARDGARVAARLYRPRQPKKGGPAVVFVHGAGYLQNVHRWWSSYSREYMFHNFLADNGYTVLDIDYRGSDGYGRDWRTGIYRHMGGKDLSDQVDGVKYLVEKYGVDPKRIGMYGGSYGGFITLMALFTNPETFRCGAALRSVTDWAHYNHGYTSNILNTPAEDPKAYERSSPINFAQGLSGDLLMLHGMVDVNVQFQDIVRLTQRLIELGKDNWDLAVFPVEDHGFVEASSWTDEYKRIFRLFETHLKK